MAFIDMTQIIMKMFKNPLKYQSGGSTPTQQQQDQLVQLFQAAAQNAQVDPEALVKKAQELGQDENSSWRVYKDVLKAILLEFNL